MKHPNTYSRMVKVKADEIRQDLLDIITAVKEDLTCIGFTTDLWTSRAGIPFMSLTIHFIDKEWKLHRFTPYVAPFPARHTGENIALGLDAMIEELELDGSQWDLFCVNDNGANVKLGIRLSRRLNQYLCDNHTLELAVKDSFKNTPGMETVLTKTKALAKFTNKSTVATSELKQKCLKEKIQFKKLANPPNTRWSGKHDNLASVLHARPALMSLMASNDNWSDHVITSAEWKLIEGAVAILKVVKTTIKVLEAEKVPTIHRVIERLYTMHSVLDQFINDRRNNMHGVGFARELKKQLEIRFPNTGSENKYRRFGNYLAPQFRGIHLDVLNKLEDTKN